MALLLTDIIPIQIMLQRLPIFSDLAGPRYKIHLFCLNELAGAANESLSQTDTHAQVVTPWHLRRVVRKK